MDGRRPILVTGSHRSGTTWVGRMLAAAPGVAYIHEPFNPEARPRLFNVRFPYWFPYVCAENEDQCLEPMREVITFRYTTREELRSLRSARDAGRLGRDWMRLRRARQQRATPLVKDPIAIFSAEWMWKTFDFDPVVLVRHPAAFIGSLTRWGWTVPFQDFLTQPLLMRDVLAPFEEEIVEFASCPPSVLDQSILLWKMIHHAILGLRDRHPDWLFVRHEDIARDPLPQFEHLYAALGLDFSDDVKRHIGAHSDPANPTEVGKPFDMKRDSLSSIWTWKSRLTEDEVQRIRERLEPVAKSFYSDDDW